MELTQIIKTAKEFLVPQFKKINGTQNAKIARVFVYPMARHIKGKMTEVLMLHIVMRKATGFAFDESDFHDKMEKKLGCKIKYHMSHDGEAGKFSSPPTNAVKIFDGGFDPIPTQKA